MEYIQCPHCQKKYGVNDKIRAASGKTIRCKGCNEPFEITIFSTPAPQPEPEEQTAEAVTETPETTKEHSEPSEDGPSDGDGGDAESDDDSNGDSDDEVVKPKTAKTDGAGGKFKLQIIASSVLGLVLIAGLIFAYQLMQAPAKKSPRTQPTQVTAPILTAPALSKPKRDEVKSEEVSENVSETTAPSSEIEEELESRAGEDATVEPVRDMTQPEKMQAEELQQEVDPETIPVGQAEPVEPLGTEEKVATPSATPDTSPSDTTNAETQIDPGVPLNPSDECKSAATDQWFVDYMISHGSLSGSEYIRMLDESSAKTEEVHKQCDNRLVTNHITEAARLGVKPDWIRTEIDARASSIYGQEIDNDDNPNVPDVK